MLNHGILPVNAYEGLSIFNREVFIALPLNALGFYAIYGIKKQSLVLIFIVKFGQPDYLHANTCHNVQKMYTHANINEKLCFARFISV